LARTEAGIALLISIFVLLLISVVAIALIVSSGTETSLAGNYRSSTGVYYAALSGIEEARGRLSSQNPNSFKTTWPAFYPTPGSTLPIGTVGYVLNPGPGEAAGSLLTTYPDTEYASEFGAAPSTTSTTLSIWNKTPLTTNLSFPGPLYKWVRINAVSELSLKLLDSYPFIDGSQDPTPLYYDGQHLTDANPAGQLPQVFELTALAVLPNASGQNSQKLVQYLVAPTPLNLNLAAALTLDGGTPTFKAPQYQYFWVRGDDQGSVGACNPNPTPSTAVAYVTGSLSNFLQPSTPLGIPVASPNLRDHYTNGVVASNPDIVQVTLSPNLQTVAGLNALVKTIQDNADVVVNGNATQANFPAGMSATNPMTIVINGDLTISGWRSTGYGLLLVTGQFTYDPDTSWDGIVLVIGQGMMRSFQGAYANTQILGAVFLARTLSPAPSTSPLPPSSPPGSPNFDFTYSPSPPPIPTTNFGFYYSSCWIQAALPTVGYKILSFHEISQ
jgi:hypothetical protein